MSELGTFAGAETVVRRDLHALATRLIERSGALRPFALVIATTVDGRTLPEPMGLCIALEGDGELTEEAKDSFASAVRNVARETKALGVILMVQGWLVRAESPAPMSLLSEPRDRRLVVVFLVEHGRQQAMLVAPVEQGQRCLTLGPIEESGAESREVTRRAWSFGFGRFCNLAGKQAEA